MDAPTRYALYVTPEPGSALAAFGEAVLGDAHLPGWDAAARAALAVVTAAPRVYGFHATLKAPMRLAAGRTEGDLLAACAALAQPRAPLAVGPLAVTLLGDFVALVPTAPPPGLGLLAAECVAALDPFRAGLTPAERARRQPERLDARRRALLDRWGYPHVFEAFRFHMTLTGRLAGDARETWRARLAAACPPTALTIDAITLLRQDGAAPFRILRRIPFAA
ncbi:DUF1045 domain-containing protein [Methylobacterium sp. HMF5984]|uniref:DUF1045 domain-containing protein n=1 Tax=Methylobacterium sp. HMF5984 TaxID=3367370 RepID=UPI0038536ADD